MASRTYGMQVKESDLALMTFLNHGVAPDVEKLERYFIFEIAEDGETVINQRVMTKREMINKFDIAGTSPFIMRLKPLK